MFDKYNDWFPLSAVTPFSKLIAAVEHRGVPTISSHPHCSLGTYMFVDEKSRKAVPVTQFVDIPAMLQDIEMLSRKKFGGLMKYYNGAKGWMELKKHFKTELAPAGLTFEKIPQHDPGHDEQEAGPRRHGRHVHLSHPAGGRHALPGQSTTTISSG